MSNKKTIKLWLPVIAMAEHKLEIDIEGKTKQEIFKEFFENSERIPNNKLHYDSKIDYKNYEWRMMFDDLKDEIGKQLK